MIGQLKSQSSPFDKSFTDYLEKPEPETNEKMVSLLHRSDIKHNYDNNLILILNKIYYLCCKGFYDKRHFFENSFPEFTTSDNHCLQHMIEIYSGKIDEIDHEFSCELFNRSKGARYKEKQLKKFKSYMN